MKKLLFIITTAMFIIAACEPVYAGILGTVTDYVKGEALSLIIGGIIGALGMFGASYKLWGQAVKELGDAVWCFYRSVQPNSPGGKQITADEMKRNLKELADIYPAVAAAIASRKKVTA